MLMPFFRALRDTLLPADGRTAVNGSPRNSAAGMVLPSSAVPQKPLPPPRCNHTASPKCCHQPSEDCSQNWYQSHAATALPKKIGTTTRSECCSQNRHQSCPQRHCPKKLVPHHPEMVRPARFPGLQARTRLLKLKMPARSGVHAPPTPGCGGAKATPGNSARGLQNLSLTEEFPI